MATKLKIWEAEPGDVLVRPAERTREFFAVHILTKARENNRHVVTYEFYDKDDDPLRGVYRATDDPSAPSRDEVSEWELTRRLAKGTPA